MVSLKTTVRVRAEGLGITIKSITTFLILLYDTKFGQGNLSLLAFAFGQLLYSTTMFAKYLTYFGLKAMQPKLSSVSGYNLSLALLLISPFLMFPSSDHLGLISITKHSGCRQR
jgi:oligosaccharide translocation protein RFT1